MCFSSQGYLPHTKVIVMPSTKKSEFDQALPLKADTLLLFAKHFASVDSFHKWWKETVENPVALQMEPFNQEAYKLALSYTLMFRHLGPVTEANCMIQLRQSLVSYKYHDNEVYPFILKSMYPHFWSWCWDVLSKVDLAFDFGEGRGEELQEVFMKSHNVNAEELKGKKGIEIVNEILKHSKYLSRQTPSPMDKAIAELFDGTYFLFFSNIVRFFNNMRSTETQVEEQISSRPSTSQESLSFLKLELLKDLNKLDRHLSRFTYIESDNKPRIADKQLYEMLTFKHSYMYLPVVWTPQQLVVFTGFSKHPLLLKLLHLH